MDRNGNLAKGYEYDEFGNLTLEEGSFYNEMTFTGSVTDSATGLQYMNARFYNPRTGRFLSQDTYSGNPYDPWTQHLYSYCGNNPTSMIDPTGHYFLTPNDMKKKDVMERFENRPNAGVSPARQNGVSGSSIAGGESSIWNAPAPEPKMPSGGVDYDRGSAINYAREWYDGRNSAYYSYSTDCANFVSQCLYAGGIPMNNGWHSYQNSRSNWGADPRAWFSDKYRYNWDISESWRLASEQFGYFSNSDNGYMRGEVITISNKNEIGMVSSMVQAGDIMYFAGAEGNNPHHATIISKVAYGDIYYAGHTNSAFDRSLYQKLGGEQVHIVRIKDRLF